MEEFATKLNAILYENTRQLHSIDEKLGIASIILLAKCDSMIYSKFIYSNQNYDSLVEAVQNMTAGYDIDFYELSTNKKDLVNDVLSTIKNELKLLDNDKYYENLHNKDEFAVACYEVCYEINNNVKVFEMRLQQIKTRIKKIEEQLLLF